MVNRVIKLEGRGLRGESYADTARRSGLFGILPTDDDETVIGKINADAEASAERAEDALEGVILASSAVGLFDTVAAGEAATTDGETFYVAEDGELTLYRNESGVGTRIVDVATKAALASTDPGKGADLVGVQHGGTLALVVNAIFTPEAYYQASDGADWYPAFSRMYAAISNLGGGTIRLAQGKTYYFDRYITPSNGVQDLRIEGCNGLRIEGNGATISVKGDFHRTNLADQSITGLHLWNCRNVHVEALFLVGNVQDMTRASGLGEGPSHGVVLASCVDVELVNVHPHRFATDGFYFRDAQDGMTPRKASRRVFMRGCTSWFNARQGISLVQARGVDIAGCSFSYTGFINEAYGTSGYGYHSPGAGADVEPNRDRNSAGVNQMDTDTGNIVFRGNTFQGNRGAQFTNGGQARSDNILVTDNDFIVGGGSIEGSDAAVFGGYGMKVIGNRFDIGQTERRLYIWTLAAAYADADVLFKDNIVSGLGSLLYVNGSPTGSIDIENNSFKATGVGPYSGTALWYANAGTNINFRRNKLFVPKEMYVDGGAGDRHIILNISAVRLAEGNEYTTDLLAEAGDSGSAHFANQYGANTVVKGDRYIGTAPGPADTFRPRFNGTEDSRYAYDKNIPGKVTATYDPPEVAAGATSPPFDVTVTGAAVGDVVTVGFSRALNGLILFADVSAADTVSVRFFNPTASPINLASGTLRVSVTKVV